MNPQDTLQLRDIHLPDAVSWWPPAPGWWLLALGLVMGVLGLIWLIRWVRKPRLNKNARIEIERILKGFDQHRDQSRLFKEISIALRRIGMSYWPREQVAGVLGKQWFEQLNRLNPSRPLADEAIELLQTQPYQRHQTVDQQRLSRFIEDIRDWSSSLKGA